MKLLIVDDQEINQKILSEASQLLGHEVILASNGKEAIDQFIKYSPDVVIMDVVMPEMNGFDATVHIKALTRDHWVPVIILSALSESEDVVHGLRSGADDFIPKPVQLDVLNAKLNNFERIIAAQQIMKQQNEELSRYHSDAEEEKVIANNLMKTLVDSERLEIPGVDWWLMPADVFSGDIIAAAKNPAGVLYVMLSDGTGHGLTAALSAQLLPEIFYSMTSHGFSISSIVEEINRRINRMQLIDRFFATTLLSIDLRECVVEVWNGGNPAVLLVGEDGFIRGCFESQHLPLGIVSARDFNSLTEKKNFIPGDQIVAMSDGFVDMHQDPNLIISALQELFVKASPDARMKNLQTTVLANSSNSNVRDDVSIVLVNTELLNNWLDTHPYGHSSLFRSEEFNTWKLELIFYGKQLRLMSADVVPLLISSIERLTDVSKQKGTIYLVLTELFNNSLDHGVLGLDSRTKNDINGFETYYQLRAKALNEIDRHAFIAVEIEMKNAINIRIKDSGAGFDHIEVMHGVVNMLETHGRGLQLLIQLNVELEFEGIGNIAKVSIPLH